MKRAAWELLAVAASFAALWLAPLRAVAFLALAAAWAGWLLWRTWQGMRWRVRPRPATWPLVLGAGVVLLGGVFVLARVDPRPAATFGAGAFVLYGIWALAQQAAVQQVLVEDLADVGVPRGALPVCTGAIFGVAHLSDPVMALVTVPAGMAFTWLWLRGTDLGMLALLHAVVGAAAFAWWRGLPLIEALPEGLR